MAMLLDLPLQRERAETGVEIAYRTLGDGLPLLLLHGYPQTHAMWSHVAPALAEHFTVVAADLRGYGDSEKPPGTPDHATYSFREMAADQVSLMERLGFERFAIAGHDRGGRTAHRMALDHPGRVLRMAVLDIAPTLTMFERTDMAFAMGYYHWYFLAQPAPLPERLIRADPAFYLRSKLISWSRIADDQFETTFDRTCVAEYERCFGQPEAIHASCEDYRAAATVDLEHDRADREAGRKIACPVLVLWGGKGLVHRTYDVAGEWRAVASGEVSGEALDCGHFLPEELPGETADRLKAFFLAGQ